MPAEFYQPTLEDWAEYAFWCECIDTDTDFERTNRELLERTQYDYALPRGYANPRERFDLSADDWS